ncbi:MAG: ABC transporter permease subunit [Deltaproteobacteria bacterium]|nr:ABC transporter permease subunit [Deltaproteobacteria bacterium]
MLQRELAIALRARVTWLVAALGALLVGHGFVLAVDLYTAGSRSVADSVLMAREFDPLAGVVRPTLGGLYLAVSLLAPLVAARPVAVEKERGSLGALVLQVGSPSRVVLAKFLASLAALAPLYAGALAPLIVWRALGGHLALAETLTALTGHALYLVLVAALATAAASWTATVAQASTLAIAVVLASWAIDAAEGFAALAWLGRAADWSVTTHLTPFERGTLALGGVGWFLAGALGLLALALVGARFDMPRGRRAAWALAALAGSACALAGASRVRPAWDLTEARRASLPPAAVRALRALRAPIEVELWLDRDDSRRRQVESDVLAKLRLARPDVALTAPLDDREAPTEGDRDDGYGRLVVRVGGRQTETRSTSRRELITLIFETAGQPLPDWSQPVYPGYPRVVAGGARRGMLAVAYGGVPLALLALGLAVTRPRRRPV